MRAEEYRRFLEGLHRVKILLPDEPAPSWSAEASPEDAHGTSGVGLSSFFHLAKKPEGPV